MTIYEPTLILKADKIHIADTSRVDSWVKIEGGEGVTIGKYVHIASYCHLNIGGGTLVMDDYSAAASGAKIITGSNDIEGLSCSAVAPAEMQIIKRSKVTIGKYAVLFVGAIVLPGVTLGEGAVLAAGGVATKNIPDWEIWGGIPARKMGTRRHPQPTPVAEVAPRSVVETVNADLPGTWRLDQQHGVYTLSDDFGHYVQSFSLDMTAAQILTAARSYALIRHGGQIDV